MAEYVVVILVTAALVYYFSTKGGKSNSDDSTLKVPMDHSRYAFGCEYSEKWNALAVKVMSVKAHEGDADAQIALGYLYANGFGVSTDIATAINWYELAAEKQHPVAMFRLAGLYVDGTGVAKEIRAGTKPCPPCMACTDPAVQPGYSGRSEVQFPAASGKGTTVMEELSIL